MAPSFGARWLVAWFCLACALSSAGSVRADCFEFCDVPPPPCFREPDNPDCDPTCNCRSPTYPACDPECAPGDLECDPDPACSDNPCWSEFGDICTDPEPPCEVSGERAFRFVDDADGSEDGEIFALNGGEAGCGTLLVDRTGYYSIFDTELSESCADQRDETGYLTIRNSCNGDGWATERNAGERFLVFDSDNSPPCASDGACGADEVCREANTHGRCCVPAEPVFMGTFLLVADEPNRICIHHWCPEWQAEFAAGRDFGFVVDGCRGVNSIHFRVDATAIACEDERTLQACSFGCAGGECLPDPCDSLACPGFCQDGACVDENPCADLNCAHGCVRGRCLQNRHARGPDRDGDGFSVLADCDDTNAEVNPDRREVCRNGLDDNCDGFLDEASCLDPSGVRDGGVGVPDAQVDGGQELGAGDGDERRLASTGCGCRAVSAPNPAPMALGMIWVLAMVRRRVR